MNAALIFAGGIGERMNTVAIPKQFLELHGKPIIIHTVENFENHDEIDSIVIVCIESWISELKTLLRKYYIKKAVKILPGGSTGHESIYLGLKGLEKICKPDDIVLIHDGVRPLITKELISLNIAKVKECGTAITAEAAAESVVSSADGDIIDSVPLRKSMYIAKAPQSFRFNGIYSLYKRAKEDGLLSVDSAHLLSIYGIEMHMVKSPSNNIKITTPADYFMFRALCEAKENQHILGII